jgi:hypothetical protein
MNSEKKLQAFDTHTMRATCPNYILLTMISAKKLHAFDTHTIRATCPNNKLTSMLSVKKVKCFWQPHYSCYMPY